MRCAKLPLLTMLIWSLSFSWLWADVITLKSDKKPVFGTVQSENAKGIVLEGGRQIPAGDIIDIKYDKKAGDPTINLYYIALDKEAVLEKSKDLSNNLETAVSSYANLLKQIPKEASQDLVRRNVEFRIAYLRGRLAVEFGRFPNTALDSLKEFKDKHKDSWQISQCLQKLAELQVAQRKFADAEKTYTELSQAPVAEEVKQGAELEAAKLSMKTEKYDVASARFQALAEKLGKKNAVANKAIVLQTECLAKSGKIDEANKLLRQLLKEAEDKDLKALAHNALGENLFEQKKYKEARWEFLWVDVVYNQDPEEHAKALYYLWKVFKELNEPEMRIQEVFDTLMNPQFSKTKYQGQAKTETKK
jgi:tetratricopeptide (TPR) repeat protein